MKKLFSISCLFLASYMLLAQDRVSTYSEEKTEKWTVRKFEGDPLNVRIYTFKNGLTLITSKNPRTPRIQTMVAVRTGSKNDPGNNTGLAHYLEHMLFKGTDRYGTLDWSKEKPLLDQIDALYEQYNQSKDESVRKGIYKKIDSVSRLAAKWSIANEFDKMCQAMGAEGTNAFTSNEMTVYINDVPTNMFHKWLELESERYHNPVLRLFHTELEAVYEEKNISLDRDGEKVEDKLMGELFKKHNYGLQTTIGTVEHLKNPSLKAIREYFNAYYVPNNMAIILAGDIDPDLAADGVAEHFAWMQPKAVKTYEFEGEMPYGSPRKFDVAGPDAEWVTIGYRMPGAGTREARAARLIDLLLNNSSAGLIDLNLVKAQKVLGANSGVNTLNDYSVFQLTGKPREGQTLEQVRDLLVSQMELIRDGKFDDSLVKAIILNEEISRLGQFKENANRGYFLMESFINGQGYQKHWNEFWAMKQLTKEDIMEVAKEFLDRERVEVFKRRGTDSTVSKINKPEISSVELNRDKQSAFVTEWLQEETQSLSPVYANVKEGIVHTTLGKAAVHYVRNTENRLFSMSYLYAFGKNHNKSLPLAMQYIRYAGIPGMNAEQISKKMYALGCNFFTSVGDEETYVSLTGPEENFDAALRILEGLLNNPLADEKAFKDMIEGELKKREDSKLNSRGISSRLNSYAIYGADNPARWIMTNAELKKLTSANLTDLIKGMKVVSHELLYYGQREQGKLLATLDQIHGAPKSFAKTKPAKKFIPKENKENEVFFADYKQVQASIFWLNRDGLYNAAEEPVAAAFNQYFGGDMSSVVFQNIREAKALAYSTYAGYSIPDEKDEYCTSMAFIGTQADKFHDAIAAMNELLNGMPADSNVYALAKESLKNRIETSRTTEDYLIGTYISLRKKGQDTDANKALYEALPNLSLNDIEAFHKNHLSNRKWALCVVASKDRISRKDLEKYGKVVELGLNELFGY
ncbi:MAG: insulinase family protein [Bacteroidetes bacterium]|nr:insulinase family protein [Bacteroidota bacterium]